MDEFVQGVSKIVTSDEPMEYFAFLPQKQTTYVASSGSDRLSQHFYRSDVNIQCTRTRTQYSVIP